MTSIYDCEVCNDKDDTIRDLRERIAGLMSINQHLNRQKSAYEKGLNWDDENWLPTANNINKLPGHLKEYVYRLETNADPAGMVADNTIKEDVQKQLVAKIYELERENEELACALRDLRGYNHFLECGVSALHVTNSNLCDELTSWEKAWDEVRQEFADDPNDDYGAYLRNVGRMDDLDPRKKEKG